MKLREATQLQAFLQEEMVANLAVPVDEDGTLHIATMNYVHLIDPLRFYFMTSDLSEKARLMSAKPEVTAACNVGSYIGTPFTLQMRGVSRILDKAKLPDVLDAYFEKRGDTNRNVEGPHTVMVEFVPNWARFTDFSKDWEQTVLELA